MTHRRRLPFKRKALAAALLAALVTAEGHAAPPAVELSDLDGTTGFALNGVAGHDSPSDTVSMGIRGIAE